MRQVIESWLNNRNRHLPGNEIFILSFLIFLLISIISVAIGVGSFIDEVPNGDGAMVKRQVGYLAAPNWGVVSWVVVPFILLWIARGVSSLRDSLFEMSASGMLRFNNDSRVSSGQIVQFMTPKFVFASWIALIVIFLCVSFALFDFYSVAAKHLLTLSPYEGPLSCNVEDSQQERDWSIAAALPNGLGHIGRIENFAFSLIVYILIPGLSFGLAFAYFILFSVYYYAFNHTELSTKGISIVPNLNAQDPRCGFEILQPLFERTLFVVILSFVGLSMMSLQNIYLRTCYPDFFSFMLSNGFQAGQELYANDKTVSISKLARSLGFVFGETANMNLQIFLAQALSFFVFVVVFILVFFNLRRTAMLAKDKILRFEDEPIEEWPAWLQRRFARGEFRKLDFERLRNMAVWPVAWVRLSILIVILLLGVISMFFYKIAFVTFGLMISFLTFRTLYRLASFLRQSVAAWTGR